MARRAPVAVAVACGGLLLAGVLVYGRGQRHEKAPAHVRRTEPPHEEATSAEEQRARELASKDISAQPPDVQLRYAQAMAEATKRVVTTRREALAVLRESRDRAQTEHVDPARLQAMDDQIRRSEEQLARAEAESSAYP